jgi:glycosyltransferase involved in cell wall biosynthesis/tetratricopeptide (TPR) repeat protein
MDIPKVAELRQKIEDSPEQPEPLLELANLYVNAGCLKEAFEYLEKAFLLVPTHPGLATNIGAVAINLDNPEKAREYFEKAIELAPESVDCYHNLGLLYTSMKELDKAETSFRKILELKPDSDQAHSDMAVIYAHQGKIPEAMEYFKKAIEINPFNEQALSNFLEFCLENKEFQSGFDAAQNYLKLNPNDQNISIWRDRYEQLLRTPEDEIDIDNIISAINTGTNNVAGLKIAFFDSQNAFGKDIVAHLKQNHNVKFFEGTTVGEIQQLMQWADLSWFEWCDQMLIEATKLPKSSPIICRLHSYEAFTNMPDHVDWSKVDRLIFVNQSVDQITGKLHPGLSTDRIVIHNGVDTGKFNIPANKKLGKNVCSVGFINYKKNPALMLQCFKAIHNYDPEFKFFIAGEIQDARYNFYFDHLIPKLGIPVQMDGWITDVQKYYENKDFVISTSIFESFHYSIAEGMASGVMPLVHNWPGSENLYPEKYRFNTPDECASLVMDLCRQDRHELAQENRVHIIQNFSLQKQVTAIDEIITGMNIKPRSAKVAVKRNILLPDFVEKSEVDFGKVSLIIPTYNRAEYLEEALDSALMQTYKNLEIIVVDDGSTDDTPRILQKYRDKVKIITQENWGVSRALNYGILASTGEYISWLSSDDVYTPEKIERTVAELHADPELGMVYSDYYYIDDHSNIAQRANIEPPDQDKLEETLFQRNPINGNSVLFRREVLKKTGYFDEGLGGKSGHTADGAMWHKISHFYKVKFIPEALVYYRVHSSNVSKAVDMEKNWAKYRLYMKRWYDELWAVEAMTEDKHPFKISNKPQKKGLNIAWIGYIDPAGISAMYKAAIEKYTPHKCRLITHVESRGFDCDVVGQKVLQGGNEILTDFDSVRKIAEESDIMIFNAAIYIGNSKKESRFFDTEELPFGPIDWRNYTQDKKCAAFFFGSTSVRRNYPFYYEQFKEKGWSTITCQPDIYHNMPESHYIPILLNRDSDRYARIEPNVDNKIVIVQTSSDRGLKNIDMHERIQEKVLKKYPNVEFQFIENLKYFDAMRVKASANIGFDQMQVGDGYYCTASIEHSALGLVNIIHLDDFAKKLIARTIGTQDLPWYTPSDEWELYEMLDSLLADPQRLKAEQDRTFEWSKKWWHEKDLIFHLTEFLEKL